MWKYYIKLLIFVYDKKKLKQTSIKNDDEHLN